MPPKMYVLVLILILSGNISTNVQTPQTITPETISFSSLQSPAIHLRAHEGVNETLQNIQKKGVAIIESSIESGIRELVNWFKPASEITMYVSLGLAIFGLIRLILSIYTICTS
jgi:hypothetical protein